MNLLPAAFSCPIVSRGLAAVLQPHLRRVGLFACVGFFAACLPAQPTRGGPLSDEAAERQADIQMARKQYATALDTYNLIPRHTAVMWNKMGVAEHHLLALNDAIKDYQMALAMNPRYTAAWNNLGAAYHGEQQYDRAARAYRKALKYDPRLAVGYANLGTTYFALRKYKQGARAFQKALVLDPNVFTSMQQQVDEPCTREERVAVNYSMAKLYAAAGNQKAALDALRRALDEGFKNRKKLMEDSDFAQLRKSPEFGRMMMEEHLD